MHAAVFHISQPSNSGDGVKGGGVWGGDGGALGKRKRTRDAENTSRENKSAD